MKAIIAPVSKDGIIEGEEPVKGWKYLVKPILLLLLGLIGAVVINRPPEALITTLAPHSRPLYLMAIATFLIGSLWLLYRLHRIHLWGRGIAIGDCENCGGILSGHQASRYGYFRTCHMCGKSQTTR